MLINSSSFDFKSLIYFYYLIVISFYEWYSLNSFWYFSFKCGGVSVYTTGRECFDGLVFISERFIPNLSYASDNTSVILNNSKSLCSIIFFNSAISNKYYSVAL